MNSLTWKDSLKVQLKSGLESIKDNIKNIEHIYKNNRQKLGTVKNSNRYGR